MARRNRVEVTFSEAELALVTAAARVSHPTAKGANVARMIREAALDAAALILWPSLDALVVAMRDGDARLPGWDALPSYGGEAPTSTVGVWSWDADRVLVGDCVDDLEIVTREEWADE